MVGYVALTLSLLAFSRDNTNSSRPPAGSSSGTTRRRKNNNNNNNSSIRPNSPAPSTSKSSRPSSSSTTGRKRYDRSGAKKSQSTANRDGTSTSSSRVLFEATTPLLGEAPPLTRPNGPRPTYFTCRHTYEETLMDEITLLLLSMGKNDSPKVAISTLAPGLVQVIKNDDSHDDDDDGNTSTDDTLQLLDPVYALQTLPNCVVVSADSIKGLAQAVYGGLLGQGENDSDDDDDGGGGGDAPCQILLREALRRAPRSSLAIHGLVPGMFKGQKNPIMEHRSQKIVEELTGMLRKGYPAARKERATSTSTTSAGSAGSGGGGSSEGEDHNDADDSLEKGERWLLQVLLMTPDLAAASLVQCRSVMSGSYWPNWRFPAGLAKVDITDQVMPSSAYRKLMEALECLQIRPSLSSSSSSSSTVYDLGACPGGWTWVLRYGLNCPHVVAIDRSPLDPRLMKDDRVEFVQGDAFSFEPAPQPSSASFSPSLLSNNENDDVWMVSDVVAFPDRILELLERWCSGKWATVMIVTMKFHGSQPDFPALFQAMDVAKQHGYHCRAKHFFNNKNEVTLMLIQKQEQEQKQKRHAVLEPGVLGTPMYPGILPTAA